MGLRLLWVFERVYLKPFDKYFKAAHSVYLLQAALKINTKLLQNGSSNFGDDFAHCICSNVARREHDLLSKIKPIRVDARVNMIVIRTKVDILDITIAVCQMINY